MIPRLGILGFAHGHVNTYCAEWRKSGAARVATGWDHNPARRAKAATDHAFAPAESAAAVLGRSDIDAVVIASETADHADLVEQAAAAGKAIVLQKPLALTLAEADRIVTAVNRAKVPFTLAWQMRVDPHNLKIRELTQSGQFGRRLIVRRRHTLTTHLWKDFEKTWHVDPQLNRDIFADDVAHPMDFLYWLLGPPVSVACELGTLVNPKIINDTGLVTLRYADGSFAEIVCGFAATGGENSTECMFNNGVVVHNFGDLTANLPWPPGAIQLKWWRHGDPAWTVSDLPDIKNHGQRLAGLAAPLAEFLAGNRPPIATAEEGRAVLRIVLACYESAQHGTRINLNQESTHGDQEKT